MSRARPGEELTELEQDVLEWLARGATLARVARLVGMSEAGAKYARDRMIVKLDAQHLAHAVHQAHCLGLLDHPYAERRRRARARRMEKTKISGGDRVQPHDGAGSQGV